MTKIEPVVKLQGKHKNGKLSGEELELYSKEQMRQLGAACADVVYNHEEGVACEAAIRNLIKEMLG